MTVLSNAVPVRGRKLQNALTCASSFHRRLFVQLTVRQVGLLSFVLVQLPAPTGLVELNVAAPSATANRGEAAPLLGVPSPGAVVVK